MNFNVTNSYFSNLLVHFLGLLITLIINLVTEKQFNYFILNVNISSFRLGMHN